MGNGGTKENQNVYFRARKQAALYNEKLSSREGAAEMLGISPSTLADYELGITKFVPVDKVVLMADLYNCPELRTGYCKYECPIGKHIPLATSVSGIEGIALRLLLPDELKNACFRSWINKRTMELVKKKGGGCECAACVDSFHATRDVLTLRNLYRL